MPLIRSGLVRAAARNPRRKPAKRGAEAGFSLLEVLAALVVTMLLVLALTPFARQMLSTWARGSEAAKFVELMTRGVGVLRSDLRHAVVWAGRGEEGAKRFQGAEFSLSFLATAGPGERGGGLQMVSITVETSGDGRALVRRSAPMIGAGQPAFSDPVVLLSGPFSYRFSYHARKGQESPVWTDARELPARVELTVTGRNGSLFSAPLEFPVLASLSAACLAANNLPGCANSQQTQEDINRWMQDFGYTGDE